MTETTASVVVFDEGQVPREEILPDPARVLSGDPVQGLWNLYSDADGRFSSGIWESAVGKWPVTYAEHEFCFLIAGRIVITDATGYAIELSAGAAFVIPPGFTGTWETVEPCRKYYVIYEPGPA